MEQVLLKIYAKQAQIEKVIPISSTAEITFSKEQFRFKPSFNKTSAEPTFPLALLFPCFAIFTPHDDATNATAVEILNVLAPSPPVPQVSTICKFGLATGNLQTFKSSFAIEHNSIPVQPLALKALKKLQFEHRIFHH